MPPVRAPRKPSAPKGGSFSNPSARPQSGQERPESPTGTKPSAGGAKTTRKTNRDLLKDRLERVYMMVGTILVPFGRFFPALEPIGENLKKFSEEATTAWMELADEDAKVKSYLESITGASTWGNVIGIHFAIFATAIPTGNVLSTAFSGDGTDDPIAMARAMGLSDEEIAAAVAMGERMGGGPGDTIRSDRDPREAVVPDKGEKNPKTNGIVSPEELGVTEPGQEHSTTIPTDPSPPSGA